MLSARVMEGSLHSREAASYGLSGCWHVHLSDTTILATWLCLMCLWLCSQTTATTCSSIDLCNSEEIGRN